jgi:hypothetical protein
LARNDRLETLDRETLASLASVEGGIAASLWQNGVMAWNNWIGFQPYDKYPEPGILRRVGSCMTEFAPSGIYVEDWRYQASEPGPVAGLRLVGETDKSGNVCPREGGIVVAGDHAIVVLARREPLPEGTRAQDYVRESPNPAKALIQVFDCSVDYLQRKDDTFVINASTDPRREGKECNVLSRLMPGRAAGELIEVVDGHQDIALRQWRIDSLEPNRTFALETASEPERLAWLARESDTLIDPIRKTAGRMAACA